MSKIILVVEFSIAPGGAGVFEAAAAKMREVVDRDESGTLQYDWWLSADGSRDINIEAFADSDALVAHMANTAPLLPALLEVSEVVAVEVLGELTEAGHASIDEAATGHFRFSGGISR